MGVNFALGEFSRADALVRSTVLLQSVIFLKSVNPLTPNDKVKLTSGLVSVRHDEDDIEIDCVFVD